jgi:hypothetical protein
MPVVRWKAPNDLEGLLAQIIAVARDGNAIQELVKGAVRIIYQCKLYPALCNPSLIHRSCTKKAMQSTNGLQKRGMWHSGLNTVSFSSSEGQSRLAARNSIEEG